MTPQEAVKEAEKFFENPLVELHYYKGEVEPVYTVGATLGPLWAGLTMEQAVQKMIDKQTGVDPYPENTGR
jgi:hypothetical protein